MSPVIDLGSLTRSPLVNRVRNVYRNNTSDSALETLRMESVSLSHVRNLSTGFKSSSSDSSEGSFHGINFAHGKGFKESVLKRSRSRSNESAKLDEKNIFLKQEKGNNYADDSVGWSLDEFESPLDSDFKTPTMSPEIQSPLNFLLNYRSLSDRSEDFKDALSLNSYSSLTSDYGNMEKSPEKINVKSEGPKGTVLRSPCRVSKSELAVTSEKKELDDEIGLKSGEKCMEGPGRLSYSFDRSGYVFRIFFEPKLSTFKDTNLVPSRVIINRTPFVIGSDPTCDLVLSKRKFTFISPKHCKITFQSSVPFGACQSPYSSPTNSYWKSPDASPQKRTRLSSPSCTSNLEAKTENMGSEVDVSPKPNISLSPNSPNRNFNGIVPFRVRIGKHSPNAIIYVNNLLLRKDQYLENGDLISLGARNSNITFRVVFQNKKECQLLKSQLTTPATVSTSTLSSKYKPVNSPEDTEGDTNMSEDVQPENDDRIVLFEDKNITGVKIFVFQVFNYNVNPNYEETCDEDDKEEQDPDELSDCGQQDKLERQSEEYEAKSRPSEPETQQSLGNSVMNQHMETEEYYKLKSPMRTYNALRSPAKRSSRDVQIKNLESFKPEALIEVYSSPERMTSGLSNFNMTQESNYTFDQCDSQSSVYESQGNMLGSQGTIYNSQGYYTASQSSTGLNDDEYMDKVKFLKSIIPNNFPIAIDTVNSVSGSTTPRSGKTRYKLIGTVDASNNMNISEILPSIDELVRNNIDETLVNFQVVLKKFNTPVDRRMLENSWVFQLEFLDVNSPKIRRAIFKHEMFKEGQQELERVLKENKCRVMYIKTD
ncbi:hypothetical protein MACJ_000544 [Theileria orientalis]|uniref:FHA domain-containing protein n=1 Tax=Theileria orientalis TaxID=68886 RepID=A0A976QRF5_THEOR|nr:hypothetical protein MACJ_000544 [Theileria orientalis]